ncbi:UNVERIFIED_CONTAM: hypothetical protein PYX00_010771 [Menopon gallinae]|uniref:C2H2-type domain-containing protein n=1 Tax=Menopon gallinae TaxID=328185 RepID=A0AAW2HGU5_9NEOP
MPKIFLIKNRLEELQLKLSAQALSKGDASEPLNEAPPLAPVVRSQSQDNHEKEDEAKEVQSPSAAEYTGKKTKLLGRINSSVFGSSCGAGGHVLTRAERKEYLPLPNELAKKEYLKDCEKDEVTEDCGLPEVKHEKEEKDDADAPKIAPALRCRQVSVIQRTPSAKPPALEYVPPVKTEKKDDDKEPMDTDEIPVQDEPIDYHVPKKPIVLKKYDIKILIPILKKIITERYKKLYKNRGSELKLSEEELLKFLERFHGIQKYIVPSGMSLHDRRRFTKTVFHKDNTGKMSSIFGNCEKISSRYFEQKNIEVPGFLNKKHLYYGERTKPNYVVDREVYLPSAERKHSSGCAISSQRGNGAGFPGRKSGSCGAIMTAAAGHSRNSAAGGGSAGSSSGSAGSGGGSDNYASGGGSSGGLSGGSGGGHGGGLNPGGGGLNPGGPNKGNYGPSSPPTGSLPPFYESLKNGFPGQYLGNGFPVNGFGGPTLPMDCDTGQEFLQEMAAYALPGSNYDIADSMMIDIATGAVVDPLQFTTTLTFASPADHHALLESLSDAADLFLQRLPSDDELNQVTNMDANGLLPSEQDLITQRLGLLNTELKIESDDLLGQKLNGSKMDVNNVKLANDLSILNDNDNKMNCNLNELLKSGRLSEIRQSYGSTGESLLEDESLSPMGPDMSPIGSSGEVNMPSPVEPSVNPFPEHVNNNVLGSLQRSYDSSRSFQNANQFVKSSVFGNGDDYDESQMQQLQIQVQLQQHNNSNNNSSNSGHSMLSPGLSFSQNGLESPTMSITSPGGSVDHNGLDNNLSSPGSVNGRRDSAGSCSDPISIVPPALQGRTASIQSRLGLTGDVHIEFVNGGHGIKNPLANHDHTPGPGRGHLDDKQKSNKVAITKKENGETKFSCRVCSKSFSLQRLLNRHMKCHSDVKRYLCTFCGKGFNDTFDLKRHTRTHTGVRPYKCNLCEKSFTQRCSLESHCLKVHGVQHQYAYKERRTKMYVCEECGHTTNEPEVHYLHLKDRHPYSPALLKFYDKRHFKFTNSNFANMLLQACQNRPELKATS